MNENLAPERIPIVYMNYSGSEEPEDKWNQPVADVKHYLGFDINLVGSKNYFDLFSHKPRILINSNVFYLKPCSDRASAS